MSYSPTALMGLPLIDQDTESNTWGEIVNTFLTSRLEQGVHGIATVGLTGADVTLDDRDFVGTQGHKKCLVFTGIQTANVNVLLPAKERVYIVKNNCTAGSFTITLKASSGDAGVVLNEGDGGVVYSTGTNAFVILGSAAFQAKTALLTNILEQPATDNGVLVGTGTQWATESGATLRTSLGVPPATRAINTTSPLSGGGDLSEDRTLTLVDNGVGTQTNIQFPTLSVNAKGLVTALSGLTGKYCSFSGDGTIVTSSGITSVTRTGIGRFTVAFTSPNFTSATSYSIFFGIEAPNAAARPRITSGTQAANGFQITVESAASAQPFDPTTCHFFCLGT